MFTTVTFRQSTDLDYLVAMELFGWRWLAWHGRPTHSAPDYPRERMVRRFFPPDSELDPSWMDYFKEVSHVPATGDEPLAYCYCSSRGPHPVPHFSSDDGAIRDMEKEIHKRGLWNKYQEAIAAQVGPDSYAIASAAPAFKCAAALIAVGSKYVTVERVEA